MSLVNLTSKKVIGQSTNQVWLCTKVKFTKKLESFWTIWTGRFHFCQEKELSQHTKRNEQNKEFLSSRLIRTSSRQNRKKKRTCLNTELIMPWNLQQMQHIKIHQVSSEFKVNLLNYLFCKKQSVPERNLLKAWKYDDFQNGKIHQHLHSTQQYFLQVCVNITEYLLDIWSIVKLLDLKKTIQKETFTNLKWWFPEFDRFINICTTRNVTF